MIATIKLEFKFTLSLILLAKKENFIVVINILYKTNEVIQQSEINFHVLLGSIT